MTHIEIIIGVIQCAIEAATNASESSLAKKLSDIEERGTILQEIDFQNDPDHDAQTAAITNANNFAQSVCNGNTANRVSEAQNILNAINALL